MKILLLTIAFAYILPVNAQQDTVISNVYRWNELAVKKDSSRNRMQILKGATGSLSLLEIHASSLEPGKAPHPPHTHPDVEELIIVKEGSLKVTVNGQVKIIGAGSMALALPGEEHGFENAGTVRSTYYVLKFKARELMQAERGKLAGSRIVPWNDVPVQKTDKGERRQVVDQPTPLFSRFELHVTTLNEGLASHSPHMHKPEEIILLRKGDVQMQIGDAFYKATAGDLVFLASGVLHALKNTGNGQCEYFALQWQ